VCQALGDAPRLPYEWSDGESRSLLESETHGRASHFSFIKLIIICLTEILHNFTIKLPTNAQENQNDTLHSKFKVAT
jgi:hypothetical protein